MPIHSIVSEQDIFSSNEKIETKQVRIEDGIMTYMKQNGKFVPWSLFSTNPSVYLKNIDDYAP